MSNEIEITYSQINGGVDGYRACWVTAVNDQSLDALSTVSFKLNKDDAMAAADVKCGSMTFYSGNANGGSLIATPCVTLVSKSLAVLNVVQLISTVNGAQIMSYSPLGVVVSDTPYAEESANV